MTDTNTDIVARLRAAEAKVRELETALRPFVADKLPSTKQTIRDYDEHGLRRMMSPMEIARKAARASLSPKGT